MTREEAIAFGESLQADYDSQLQQFISVALSALEQEPNIDMECDEIKILQKRSYLEGFHEAHKMLVKQEPCDDAVNRQAVLDLLVHYFTMTERHDMYYAVKQLPSVQPKQKGGANDNQRSV